MLYVKYANPTEESTIDIKNDPLVSVLFNDAPDAIFILDAKNYLIVECNNKSLEIFETESKMSLISLSSFRLYESEPVEFSKNLSEKNMKNNGEHTQELAFRTLKQNVFWGRLKKRSFTISEKEYILLRISKINDYLSTEETLSTLLRGTAQVTGAMFLKEFVKLLCRTFDVKYSFVGKLSADKKKCTIIKSYGPLSDDTELTFTVNGTMLENVIKGYTTFYPTKVKELFPIDNLALKNNIEGFMGSPVYGNSGEVMGIVAFMNDKELKEIPNSRYIMSIFASRTAAEMQRMRSKEILKEQTRDLASANLVKDKLLAVISNDILNPLHNLISFSNHFRSKTGNYKKEEIIDKFEIIDNSMRNIYFMMENLSEWSKIQREPIHAHLELLSVKDMVDDSLKMFKNICDLKALQIDVQIDKSAKLLTDKQMYRTVIRNIISNAVIFNTQHGQINISLIDDTKNSILKIEDSGIGMSAAELKTLQKHSLTNDQYAGNKGNCGLGYNLSCYYIDYLGGNIELISTPDKGTTAIISIPKNNK